ncbi:MAG: histone deacetylase family protein [Gammaproteobacteria bacterium]|nr:histone deacetylase family protein [Gammaproteobacteria bacterium]
MKTVCSELHKKHFPKGELAGGELVRPYECPERWDYIHQSLQQAGLADFLEPEAMDSAWVALIHSADFTQFLASAWEQWDEAGFSGEAIPTVFPARRMQQREPDFIDGRLGYYAMAIETAITSGTWEAAQSSAACAQTAQKLMTAGESTAFALCRPPGHHAASDLYGGYCFLNNAAIAAQGFLNDGANRVAVLDVDFHHGNGTQDIFYQRDDVLFLSLHGDPKDAFPHFLGYADETGEGAGEGFNVNYPMPPGTAFSTWRKALLDAIGRISAYAPDALVISLGVDTFEKDPISFFKLTSEDFIRYGSDIAGLKLPTLFVMEGGYAVEEIGVNTVNVLQGFQDA